MSKVKLFVRVRPFTDKDLKCDSKSVVTVLDDETVAITNIKVNCSGAGDSRDRVRAYRFDRVFDGTRELCDPDYASQEKVFDIVGRDVLSCLSGGASACVFAYGQSATGKTHTMIGTSSEPGLAPRLCRALADDHTTTLTVSFLEIYNERVHDLLAGERPALPAVACSSLPRRTGNARKDLRVREHPSKGPYVQNLRRVRVSGAEGALRLIAQGVSRRRSAGTRRNDASSRSHALLELSTPTATLHLADLAGSEKSSWEGCSGGRQKEGANINKSLVALSNVISALVSGNSYRRKFVPYRDSALTWLLKDCFTGGANTYIIATVSPSAACYGESNSTLRWAARAKQLPAVRHIPASSSNHTRTALQTQLNQLLTELAAHNIRYIPETGKIYFDNNQPFNCLNKNDCQPTIPKKNIKIGNIMNTQKTTSNSESIASSAASVSSDVIEKISLNTDITNEINKEVDKLFGPVLIRSGSGINLSEIAPGKHEKRQYRSQEVLPINKAIIERIENVHEEKEKSQHVPILYESQRAEIVASVTERLYSKLKKKEETSSKVEDRKMEPLNELRICTNARQRLMEISRKALKNKRRIGIPAHTQTKMIVTRMRDVGIDLQTDLECYVSRDSQPYVLKRDVSTETTVITPRCKEIGVGYSHGSIYYYDKSTSTSRKLKYSRSSSVMTDSLIICDRSTQTSFMSHRRRMKRMIPMSNHLFSECDEIATRPFISINISHPYSEDFSDSQSSDNSLENDVGNIEIQKETSKVNMTPDLLTNHSTIDGSVEVEKGDKVDDNTQYRQTALRESPFLEDFSDTENNALPRVATNFENIPKSGDFNNIILGKNENVYPYNITLSPYKERDLTQRTVKFKVDSKKDFDVNSTLPSYWQPKSTHTTQQEKLKDKDSQLLNSEKLYYKGYSSSEPSDTSESSKMTTDSFIWNTNGYCEKKNDESKSACEGKSKYRSSKVKIYKEFLGMNEDQNEYCSLPTSKKDTRINYSSSDSIDTNENYRHNTHDSDSDEQKESCESVERRISESCNRLEKSVDRYESYIKRNKRVPRTFSNTPKQYLQHLVELRKQTITAESDTTDNF